MKIEQFVLTVKSRFNLQWIEERDHKAKQTFRSGFNAASLQLFFELLKNSVACSSLSSARSNPAQFALKELS